ncbi:MAG: DUF3575 domain-containing protein [Prevotella sp.]|nr:DUF3575 domain-containing protein [Bacteroides sp.]MCM1367098.1 DUF3575 domain-containing protein [Prevotella sp.]MCM1437363.1 DUF3575 domain-containing protein [Prevotella sp.]
MIPCKLSDIYYLKRTLCTFILLLFTAVTSLCANDKNESDESHFCITSFAIKSNLLHDALLTPDLGIEVGLHNKFSVSAEGVWAWWSNNSKHRFWRIYGAWIEGRYWFGKFSSQRHLSGHHAGVYLSAHTYDFEFGGKGWQSPNATFGVGLSYGYSFRISSRLNVDLSARVGYSSGKLITYHPQCGEYVCISRHNHHYFGPTDLSVTFVWFPGRNKFNKPDR